MTPISKPSIICLGAVLLASACGGESAGGDADAFCELLRDAEAGEQLDIAQDLDAAIEEFQRWRDVAPDDVRDDIDALVGAFEEFNDLEESGAGEEEVFAAAMALGSDPRFTEASDNIDRYGVEECGLDPSADDGADAGADDNAPPASSDDDEGDGEGPAAGEMITEAADVDDPLWWGAPFEDPIDPTVVSIEGAQYFLDSTYPDAPWRTRLGSWSVSLSFGNAQLSAGGVDVTADEAQEICDALAEYLTPIGPEATIEIETYTQNDDGTFGTRESILSGTAANGC